MSEDRARKAALEVLTRVRERSAYAHETLDAVLKSRKLEPRDAAFATRLAYGAVATRGTLDEAVARSIDPGTVLTPAVADALALGAYEVLFAGTPHHAAVNQTVELVRSVDRRAAGLANAVMRRITRAAADFPWGDPRHDNAALARLYGHPRWLAEEWILEMGRDAAERVMAADNLPAPLFLARLAPDLDDEQLEASLLADGLEPQAGPLPGSWVARVPSASRNSEVLSRLDALVMDAGAQFAACATRPRAGDNVVEIGAGRGGKTLLLAALARRAGGAAASVTGIDLHSFKLEALERNAQRLGFDEVRAVQGDASDPGSDLGVTDGSADVVLVDAPCSGLGTLRRHPDRRWRARSDEIEALAELGAHLLRRAARLVRPGGFVVYSTCTIARRENADVIESFLATTAGSAFVTDPLTDDVPKQWVGYLTSEGWFQSLPEPDGPDGHFVARLRRAPNGQ